MRLRATRVLLAATCMPHAAGAAQTDPAPATAAPATAAPAVAAAAPTKAIEEVVVTAERRRTSLQKTPIAVTKIGGETLTESGSHQVRDLSGQIPNVEIPRGGLTPTTQVFFIRGIGTSDPIQDPAVGVYVDDIYIPRPISDGGLFDLPDLDHVEVLRGPQGTLYGRNSDAGAVRLVTQDPGDDLHIVGDAGVGDYGAFLTHDLVSGPLVPGKVFASLAFVHSQRDGTTDDPTIGRRVNDIDVNAARGKLRFTPNDDLDIQLTADGMIDHSNTAYYTPLLQKGGFNPNLSLSPIEPLNDLHDGGVGLRIAEKLADNLTLKSITSARAWDQAPVIYDNAGSATEYSANYINYHQHDYTEELQLAGDYGRFNFAAGFFYYNEAFGVDRLTVSLDEPRTHTLNRTTTASYAGYSQGNYHITDDLTLTLGIRYTLDAKTFDDGNYTTTVNPAAAPYAFDRFTVGKPLFTSTSDHSWGQPTPKAALSYQVTPLILTYASYAEGFKSGGYDNRSANAEIAKTPFQPETVDTYEVGVKSDWLNHRVRADLALFYNDYTNLQQSIYVSTLPGAPTELVNAGHATTDGAELETTLVPFDGFVWTNNAGYLNAEYDKFLDAGPLGASATGKRLPLAPRWNLTSAADYQVPLGIPGTTHVGGDVEFSTIQYSDVLNTPGAAIPSQAIVNVHASYTTADDRWTALLTIRNALDRRFNQTGTYVPPVEYFLENPPRTVLFTLRYAL
jgi:iron complex outermembrane receptor protein